MTQSSENNSCSVLVLVAFGPDPAALGPAVSWRGSGIHGRFIVDVAHVALVVVAADWRGLPPLLAPLWSFAGGRLFREGKAHPGMARPIEFGLGAGLRNSIETEVSAPGVTLAV